MFGNKISRFERFKQKMLGKRDIVLRSEGAQHIGISEAMLKELLNGSVVFSEPVPFLVVELECPPEMQKEWEPARVDLSTGPVWVFPVHDRKTFLSYLDDTSEDFIDEAVAHGADGIVAVFRGDKFALVPVSIRPHALKAVVEAA